jgi:transposase-like protein
MKTRDARSLPSEAQEETRQRAVQAVVSGKTQIEVASLFGVTRQAVGQWMSAYRGGGRQALKRHRDDGLWRGHCAAVFA